MSLGDLLVYSFLSHDVPEKGSGQTHPPRGLKVEVGLRLGEVVKSS